MKKFWACSLALNLVLISLTYYSPKRSRRRKQRGDNEDPLLSSYISYEEEREEPSADLIKINTSSRNYSDFGELSLTETQIALIISSPPLSLAVKLSNMKVKDGQRLFSFSTVVSNIPKLVSRTDQIPSQESQFEFTQDWSTPTGDEEPRHSTWVTNGQPSTLVIQNVKRTQQQLSEIFDLLGLDDYSDQATQNLSAV